MTLAMWFVGSTLWTAQPPEAGSGVAAEPFRVVSATPEDLGTVQAGVAVVREVRLRNTSEHTLRPKISFVSCGCLAAKAEPEAVGPGEEFTIRLVGTAVPAGPDQDLTARYVVFWSVGERPVSVEREVVVRYSPASALVVRPSEAGVWRVAGEPLRLSLWVRESTAGRMPPGTLQPVIEAGADTPVRLRAVRDATALDGPSAVCGELEFDATALGVLDGWVSVGSTPEASAMRVPIRVRTVPPWSPMPGAAHLRAAVGEAAGAEVRLRPVGSASELPACSVNFEPAIEGLSAKMEATTLRFEVARLRGSDGSVAVVRDRSGRVLARVPVVLWPTVAPR